MINISMGHTMAINNVLHTWSDSMRLGDSVAAEFVVRQYQKEHPGTYCAVMEFEPFDKTPNKTKANEVFGDYVDEIVQYGEGQTCKNNIIEIANKIGADTIIGWSNHPYCLPHHQVIGNYRWLKGLQEPFVVADDQGHILEKEPFSVKYSGPSPELASQYPSYPAVGELKHSDFSGKYYYADIHTVSLAYRAKGYGGPDFSHIKRDSSLSRTRHIVFHARSIDGWFGERKVSQEVTDEIIQSLKKLGRKIVLVGSSGDKVKIAQDEMIVDLRPMNLRLAGLISAIEGCSLFIGPISSMMQISASLNCKTIVLPPIYSLCEPNMPKDRYHMIFNFSVDELEYQVGRMLGCL